MRNLCSFRIPKHLLFKYKKGNALYPVVILFLFFLQPVNATIKLAVGNTGQGWSVASNWSPSGVPQSGDEVIIPAGFTISVKNTIYSSPFPFLNIKVWGILDLDPSGKIDLSSVSLLHVYTAGQITSNGTNSELIYIGSVNKFNGIIDGTINGPAVASAITGISPNGFNSALAIKLTSFNYLLANNTVKLNWTASHDNPADKFQVQRNNGNGWITLSEIAAAGTMNILNNYSYTDASAFRSINLYRIKLLNADGVENYSKTISVNLLPGISSLSVFPNPASSIATLTWKNNPSETPVYIEVINASMNRCMQKQVSKDENSFYLDLSRYPSGSYIITVTNHADFKESIHLLVNH
jgi:hypothetical protein